jgi:endonuclease YncB( thermonuclease family)
MFPIGWAGDYTAFSTNTQTDGMFYFRDVPPGIYDCWVEMAFHYRITVGSGPTQDVAPLLIQQARPAVLQGAVIGIVEGDFIIIRLADKSNYFVRLRGIYTPKTPQSFADQSRRNLAGSTSAKIVTVEYEKADHYGRIVGKVLLNGQDLCLKQLKDGMAWSYQALEGEQTEKERSAYVDAEGGARKAKLGLWASGDTMARGQSENAALYAGQSPNAPAWIKYVGEQGESVDYLFQKVLPASDAPGVLKGIDGSITASVTSQAIGNKSLLDLFTVARGPCEAQGARCESNVVLGEPFCIQKDDYFVVTCKTSSGNLFARTALSPGGRKVYTLTVTGPANVINSRSFRAGMD